ncbi:MAG: hypothetical protein FWF81_13820 [Defluviitaleaceae bacterium]|nr:hypothetical protein [Defluviitaleaceae bacterium]
MSSLFNKALLTEQLKRFWAIPAIAILVYVLGVYVPLVNAGTNREWWAMQQLVHIITLGNGVALFTVVATPIAAAFCTFGCFFNKRATTAFYTFPLNKTQLFATNALAGTILSLIPVLVFCILLLFPLGFHDVIIETESFRYTWDGQRIYNSPQAQLPLTLLPGGVNHDAVINTIPIIAGLFMRMALITVFYFAMAWLAFSLAGHGIIALLICGIMPFVPFAFISLAGLIAQLYIFGHISSFFVLSSQFFAYHNPAVWGNILNHFQGLSRMQAVIIPYTTNTILTITMFAGAFAVSRIRKPERTGNSVMFGPVKNVLVFLVSFVGMLIVGGILFATSESLFMLHVGFIIGFAIAYVIAQMIAEKSFYIFPKLKYLLHFTGVATASYIIILLVTQFGMGFYVNRVPHSDEIYAVHATTGWFGRNTSVEDLRLLSNSNPEFIAAVQEAHRTILDGASYLHSVPHIHRGNYRRVDMDGNFISRETLHITYILNNGRTVRREYSLPGTFVTSSGLADFLDSRDVVLSSYPVINMPELLINMDLEFSFPPPLDEERGWHWGPWSRYNVRIFYTWQIYEMMELLADAAVENAVQRRRNHSPDWDMRVEDALIPIQLHTSYNFDWDNHDINRMIPNFWQRPFIHNEPAWDILQTVIDWGLVNEENLENLLDTEWIEFEDGIFRPAMRINSYAW